MNSVAPGMQPAPPPPPPPLTCRAAAAAAATAAAQCPELPCSEGGDCWRLPFQHPMYLLPSPVAVLWSCWLRLAPAASNSAAAVPPRQHHLLTSRGPFLASRQALHTHSCIAAIMLSLSCSRPTLGRVQPQRGGLARPPARPPWGLRMAAKRVHVSTGVFGASREASCAR